MAKVSYGAIATIRSEQTQIVVISGIVTLLAAIVGLIFANLVSGEIIRSVRQLLEGTRAVEAGRLDQSIDVRTSDEIGQLAAAFNRMVVQLRDNQRVRETFGKYIDPRVVEGLIDRPDPDRSGRSAPGDDGGVLRPQGVHQPERGHDAARPRQGHEPLPFHHVRANPHQPGNHRQVSRRRHHGLLGTAVRRRVGSRPSGMSCRDGNGRAHPDIAAGNSRIAGRAGHADGDLRSAYRHRDGRGAGRQHRLRCHDELHRDGRRGESFFAAGGRQQDVRHPHAGVGADGRGRPAPPSSFARST